ncbi:MAG: RcpC/CpaB family pilus assembly protein, partial [Agromyces sp.]
LISNRWVNSSEFDPSGGLEIPDGYQAITVALPVERVVGGTVQAGGTVGIVVTSGQPGQAKQILHKVLVLSVTPGTSYVPAANSNSSQATEPVSVLMVTLALKTPDLEKVAWGVDYGKLWLTREPASAVEGGNVTTDFNLLFG